MDQYGADLGLDLSQQAQLTRLQIPLETSADSPIPFWFSEETLAGQMYAVAHASGRRDLPPPASLRDLSLLEKADHSLGEQYAR